MVLKVQFLDQTPGISITRKPVRHAQSWALPQSYWVRNGLGPTSQALTSPPGHCATHSSLRITSIRKSSDKRGKKGARRGLMLARAVSPGENGGGYHQLLRWAHAVSDPWRHHDLDGSELKKCSGLDRNCTASCGSNPSNVLWPTAPPSLGPSSQPWGRLRVIWKREDSQNFMPFGADL